MQIFFPIMPITIHLCTVSAFPGFIFSDYYVGAGLQWSSLKASHFPLSTSILCWDPFNLLFTPLNASLPNTHLSLTHTWKPLTCLTPSLSSHYATCMNGNLSRTVNTRSAIGQYLSHPDIQFYSTRLLTPPQPTDLLLTYMIDFCKLITVHLPNFNLTF